MKSTIAENYKRIREEIPEDVSIVVAAKTRTKEEIIEVIDAGAEIIGENYVQEAEKIYQLLGDRAKAVKWHMIGELQKNKINKALRVFDVIETVDSLKKADDINKRAERQERFVRVFIEINIGSEFTKAGVRPEYEAVIELAEHISNLKYLKLNGLMTMGPRAGNPEESRPYFKKTKEFFEKIRALDLPNVEMDYLSMGMSNSYQVAIEEGANMVRLGTVIFGERACSLT
ncbi:MAG: YggS family pyridoxal phosphate-dependent enzyme [Elusimicrobia bacterium]|nr:YggS family pyridoxal phosphate-dependent enzyme [Elusimicrobiota bacterium]